MNDPGRGHSEKLRVSVSLAVGVVAWAVAGQWTEWQMASLIAFDIASVVQLVWIWSQYGGCDAADTRRFAARAEDSHLAVRVVMFAASAASVVGVVVGLTHAHTLRPPASGVMIGLSILTVAMAWTLLHSTYTLRYAHAYYFSENGSGDGSGGDPPGGIEFPPDGFRSPKFTDFAYVAFTIGMSFTLAETPPSTYKMRTLVTGHALLSYVFGAVIVGMAINVMAGLIG